MSGREEVVARNGASHPSTGREEVVRSRRSRGRAGGGNPIRAASETVSAGDTSAVVFEYDADGLLTCASPTTCPSGAGALRISNDPLLPRATGSMSGLVTDALTYNQYGELASYAVSASGTELFGEVLDTATAPRDNLGRIVERVETNGAAPVTYGYEYDLQGRLSEVYEDGTLAESYTYDANGNRLSLTTPEGTVTGTYDDQDRLLTYGEYAYTYTANGELLTKTNTVSGDITAYEYDVFGNLVRVDLPDGTVIEYLVDGQNRRVAKLVNGITVKQWLWSSQLRIAAELDGSGNLVSRFVYGNKPTTPELVVQGSAVYRVISDHLGSVRALVNVDDVTDAPVRLDYGAFGEVSGVGVGVVPQGFAGGLYDAETGLVRFGARDYDPVTGRWTGKDPIRWSGGQGNLFIYAAGDPVNRRDPSGLQSVDWCGSTGSEWVPDRGFGVDWSDACKTHDECYSRCGASKLLCDHALGDDIALACAAQGGGIPCFVLANAYNTGVDWFGDEAFQRAQEENCSCQ